MYSLHLVLSKKFQCECHSLVMTDGRRPQVQGKLCPSQHSSSFSTRLPLTDYQHKERTLAQSSLSQHQLHQLLWSHKNVVVRALADLRTQGLVPSGRPLFLPDKETVHNLTLPRVSPDDYRGHCRSWDVLPSPSRVGFRHVGVQLGVKVGLGF